MSSGSPTGPSDLPEQSNPGIIDTLTFAVEQCRSAGSWEERIDDVIAKLGRAADVSRVLLWENRRTDDDAILRARLEPVGRTILAWRGDPWSCPRSP